MLRLALMRLRSGRGKRGVRRGKEVCKNQDSEVLAH